MLLMLFVAACTDGNFEMVSDREDHSARDDQPEEREEIEEIDDTVANEIERAAEDLANEMEKAAQEFVESLSDLGKNGIPDDPDYLEDLERLLPDDVEGVEAIVTRSRVNIMGFGMAEVNASYVDEETYLSIDIVDMGPLGTFTSGLTEKLQIEVDSSSDTGFERTRTYRHRSKEYQAFESYSRLNGDGECEIVIWVADRYIINISGTGEDLDFEDCQDAREELSFRRIENLARKYQAQDD